MNKLNKSAAHAPYNFVPFPEKIIERYNSISELPAHDSSNTSGKNLLSGEITIEIVAKTPILVADGNDNRENDNLREFVKNAKGEYEIPGSTLRGLLRQTIGVLSLSDWTKQIEDETFYYRAVAGKNQLLRKNYAKTLDLKQESVNGKGVKAGYIVKKSKNKYFIYPAKADSSRHNKTYYKCHKHDYKFLRNDINKGFMIKDATFSINEYGKVTQLNTGKGKFKGKLLFSEPMNNKKTAYVINEIDYDEAKIIEIEDKDLKAYQADYVFRCEKFGSNPKGERRERMKEFFALPKKTGLEGAKPCFYIYKNNRLYFGFTAYLRLTYDFSTRDLLPEYLKKEREGIDYASALFGFTNMNGNHYASRLSFLSAKINGSTDIKQVEYVFGQPRASALSMYLIDPENSQNPVSYNDKSAQLRGLKQYWIHRKTVPSQTKIENNNMFSKLHVLNESTKFNAIIRFKQLYEDELGLLLWSIKAPKLHQLGMAKPYGYGVVQFKNVTCQITTDEQVYLNLSNFFDIGMKQINIDEYILKYKNYVKANYQINVEEQQSVSVFLTMKENSPLSDQELNYMSIKEYQNTPLLPTVQTILDKKKRNT